MAMLASSRVQFSGVSARPSQPSAPLQHPLPVFSVSGRCVVCHAKASKPASSKPAPSLPKRNKGPDQPNFYPGVEEEDQISHAAFHSAFNEAKPEEMRVPGLQEFAAALWERRRHIPSSSRHADPLMNLFNEFDTDGNGVLSAEEIAQAFSSVGVRVTAEQIQWCIDRFEDKKATEISREQWSDFVYSLAVSNLKAKGEFQDKFKAGRSLDSLESVDSV